MNATDFLEDKPSASRFLGEDESYPPEYYAQRRKQVVSDVLGAVKEGVVEGAKGYGQTVVDLGAGAVSWIPSKLNYLGGIIRGKTHEEAKQAEASFAKAVTPEWKNPDETAQNVSMLVGKGLEGLTYPLKKVGGAAGAVVGGALGNTSTGDNLVSAMSSQTLGTRVPEGYKYNELGELERIAPQYGEGEEPQAVKKGRGVGEFAGELITFGLLPKGMGKAKDLKARLQSYSETTGLSHAESLKKFREVAEANNVTIKDVIYQPPEANVPPRVDIAGKRRRLQTDTTLEDLQAERAGVVQEIKQSTKKADRQALAARVKAIDSAIEEVRVTLGSEVKAERAGTRTAEDFLKTANEPVAEFVYPDIVERARVQESVTNEPTIPLGEGPATGVVRQNAPAKGGMVEGGPIDPLVNREAEMGNYYRGTIPETTYVSKPEVPVSEGVRPLYQPTEGIVSQNAGGRPKAPTVNLESSGLQTIWERLVDGKKQKLESEVIPQEGAGTKVKYLFNGKEVGSGQLLGKDITSIQVKEEFRNKGIGTEIMKDMISRGGEAGYPATEAGKRLMAKVGMEDIGGARYGLKKTQEPGGNKPFVMNGAIQQKGIYGDLGQTEKPTGISFYRGSDFKPIAEGMKQTYPYSEHDVSINNPFFATSKQDIIKKFGINTKGNDSTIDLALKQVLSKNGYDGWVIEKEIGGEKRITEIADFRVKRKDITLESGGLQTIYEKFFTQPEPPRFAQPGTPEAAIENIHRLNREAGRKRDKMSFEKVKSVVFKNITGTDANAIRKIENIGGPEAQRIVRAKAIQRGSEGWAKILIDQNNEMFKGMSQAEYQLLNDYRESLRVIEIKGYKPQHLTSGGETAATHQRWIDSLPSEVKARLDVVNEKVKAAYRSNLDSLKENGLIDQAGYDNLANFENYSPQEFIEHLDPVQKTGASGKINIHDSGIKALKEGSEGLLMTDSRFLLNEATARVQARIFKNNVNKSVLELIDANPQNGIFERAKIADYTKDGKPIFQDAPTGHSKISAMVDGKEQQIILPDSIAKEWVKNNPLINQTYATMLSWMLGSKILKASATGMNPAFALPNMLRDMVMIWSVDAGKNYSPHAPVAMAQMAKDLKIVANDVIHKKGRYLDYLKEGGGMETLTKYGEIKGPLKGTSEVLGWVGNTSEFLTRLAYRERALRNLEKQGLDIKDPKVREQATYTARNYLDFNQGGDFVKFLDIGFPYLNPGVQATKSMANAARTDPALFLYKMAQLGAISAMIYTTGRAINPEAIDQTDDRTKSNNWVIPLPEFFSYLDENGQLIHSTIKIPKEQGVRPFASLFEAGMERIFTGKIPTQQTLNSIGDVFSIIPVNKLPPVFNAYMGYGSNKDFYSNSNIWQGSENVTNEERWDHQDNPFWKMIGQTTGLDPKRTRYAMSQLFTANNPVVSLIGTVYDTAFGDLPKEIQQKALMDLVSSNSIARRIIGRTNPYTPYAADVKASKEPEETKRYVLNRELSKLTGDFIKDNTEENKQKIQEYISQQDEHEQDRMTNRVLDAVKIHGMKDRSWWNHVSNIQIPEARARAFYTRWSKASDEEKDRLVEQAGELKGFLTERVVNKILELKRSGK